MKFEEVIMIITTKVYWAMQQWKIWGDAHFILTEMYWAAQQCKVQGDGHFYSASSTAFWDFGTCQLTSFLTHDLELIIALNSGMGTCRKSSGCMHITSVKIVWQESMKQLSTTLLNSVNQDRTWRCPCGTWKSCEYLFGENLVWTKLNRQVQH